MGTDNETLLQNRLSKGEKIAITSGTHQYLAFFLFILTLAILFSGLYFNQVILDFIPVGLPGLITGLALVCLLLLFLSIRIADIGIRKDIVFINHFFIPCRVISVEELVNIKSISFLNNVFTFIRYDYNGSTKRAMFIKRRRKHNKKVIELLQDLHQVNTTGKEKSANL